MPDIHMKSFENVVPFMLHNFLKCNCVIKGTDESAKFATSSSGNANLKAASQIYCCIKIFPDN